MYYKYLLIAHFVLTISFDQKNQKNIWSLISLPS
jgi:hypothetical protein